MYITIVKTVTGHVLYLVKSIYNWQSYQLLCNCNSYCYAYKLLYNVNVLVLYYRSITHFVTPRSLKNVSKSKNQIKQFISISWILHRFFFYCQLRHFFLSRPTKQFIGRGFINSESNYGLDGRGHIFGSFINLRSTRLSYSQTIIISY